MKFEFIKSIISDETGSGSSNRTAMMAIILMILVWTTYIVYLTKAVPDISDSWLTLVGIFVTGGATGKVVDAYKIVKAPKVVPEEGPAIDNIPPQ